MTTVRVRDHRAAPLRRLQVVIGVLLVVMAVFLVRRLLIDVPHLAAGTVPGDDMSVRFVAHPWLTYLHIAPGVVYLALAPFQLSARFRRRHHAGHRRTGRLLVTLGLLSGALALVLGLVFPWGGVLEGSATVVFGVWFVACLVTAYAAIRAGDVARHRAFMVRAFAVGVGVGTIRLWVGVFTGVLLATGNAPESLPERTSFGAAFWLGLAVNALVAEWWLRRTPAMDG